MGTLVDSFGGKTNGELIRASDWNGMLAAVEASLTNLEQAIETRLTPLEVSVAALDGRVGTLEGQIADLVGVAATLRARYRRITLATTSTSFAIGQRGEIVANITSFDGTPLALSDVSTRPWVDFITPWGSLSAVAGFTSRAGATGRTLSVQVNAAGEARVLLQADHASNFSEADQADVQDQMSAFIQTGGQSKTIVQAILESPTPASNSSKDAFKAMSDAYSNPGNAVMRNYLDQYYLEKPSVAIKAFGTWTDYLTTVLAFVKADANPVSPDGAMAAGSIQVTFRDWVRNWIQDEFFSDLELPAKQWREIVPPLVKDDLRRTVDDILGEFEARSRSKGLLGAQREAQAASEALRGLTVTNPLPFFSQAIDATVGALAVQTSLSYSQALIPGVAAGPSPVLAFGSVSTQSVDEATRVGKELTSQFEASLDAATDKLTKQVKTEQQLFEAELLREDGVIANAKKEASDARGAIEVVNRALQSKADFQFVTDFVRNR